MRFQLSAFLTGLLYIIHAQAVAIPSKSILTYSKQDGGDNLTARA